MKKFAFSLQSLLGIKESLEKQQKAELLEVEQRLSMAVKRLNALKHEFAMRNRQYIELAQAGTDATTLQAHGNYFILLSEHIDQQEMIVAEIQREKEMVQQKLWLTMREIKMLENLKERQYEEYLVEVRREEDQDINDLLSYRSSVSTK